MITKLKFPPLCTQDVGSAGGPWGKETRPLAGINACASINSFREDEMLHSGKVALLCVALGSFKGNVAANVCACLCGCYRGIKMHSGEFRAAVLSTVGATKAQTTPGGNAKTCAMTMMEFPLGSGSLEQ